MKLQISELAEEKINKSILITGSARSGTTILGKIIHSLQGIEYAFEPPILFSLIPLIEKISQQEWQLLFETYLYEDFFLNAISGRNINCNRTDDSSIFNVKSEIDIESRLKKSIRKIEAEELGKAKILAFKLPDIVPFIPKIQSYYNKIKIIIIKRDAIGTINSLMAKHWFSNENSSKNIIWPFRVYRSLRIPYWVDEKDFDLWFEMSEIDRCAYYYITINKYSLHIRNSIEIDYNQLLQKPLLIAKNISQKLNLKFSDKTKEVINQVKPTIKNRDKNIINKITNELRYEVMAYSSSIV